MNAHFKKYETLLTNEQKNRKKNQDLVHDPVESTKNPQWVLHERKVLLDAVNADRALLNLPAIDDVTFVRKAERQAAGHSDYSSKFAFYASELARGATKIVY